MPPRPLMMADRIQRLEAAQKAQADELQELRLFCLDIHPEQTDHPNHAGNGTEGLPQRVHI
jgi:hypothetical protein